MRCEDDHEERFEQCEAAVLPITTSFTLLPVAFIVNLTNDEDEDQQKWSHEPLYNGSEHDNYPRSV